MQQQHRTSRRGVTAAEVVAVILIIALMLAVLVPMMLQRPRVHGVTKDETQLQQIYKAMQVFGRQFNGILPRPGLINPLPFNGVETPGLGAEDVTRNTTANLYSSLIAQHFVTPALLVSGLERNPKVVVDADYNITAYSPATGVYWDESFVADLETGSNASFAHLPLWGKRGREQWRDTMDPQSPLLSHRGPRDGRLDARSYTLGRDGRWSGAVVFADGHVETCRSTSPEGLQFLGSDGALKPDNLFAIESDDESDRVLAFTKFIDESNRGELQFD